MQLIKRDPTKAYVDTWLWIPKAYVNLDGTKHSLTFYVDGDEKNKVRELCLWRETAHHLLVPRALWRTTELPYPVIDCRPQQFTEIDFSSTIKLDHQRGANGLAPTGLDVQHRAVAALQDQPGGILQLSCGKGKTIVFLDHMVKMRVPTIVIIDNTTLLKQWQAEVEALIDVPGGVGLIQAETFDWKHGLVLSTYHTLAARADTMPEEVRRWFGLICWDEGHHISAPTFAKTADLFYGKRIALTATPTRVDGTHVVYEFHVGPVIFKDLSQAIKPRIYFRYTGIQINALDPLAKVRDRNNEIHLMMLFAHLGSQPQKIDTVLGDVKTALAYGRKKVLVLSSSITTIMNVATRLVHGPDAPLYSDISVPTPDEVGEAAEPLNLSKAERRKVERNAQLLRTQLQNEALNPVKRESYRMKLIELETVLTRIRVFDKIRAKLKSRQKAFLRKLEPFLGTEVGVMINNVDSDKRLWYARNSRVVLAIMKYGKEGLDAPSLDTALVCDPLSQRNWLQQLMGRVVRPDTDKLEPVVVFYEDNVGPIIAMCKKLRQHLSEWSHEEGGPFPYQLAGHPKVKPWDQNKIFSVTGQ